MKRFLIILTAFLFAASSQTNAQSAGSALFLGAKAIGELVEGTYCDSWCDKANCQNPKQVATCFAQANNTSGCTPIDSPANCATGFCYYACNKDNCSMAYPTSPIYGKDFMNICLGYATMPDGKTRCNSSITDESKNGTQHCKEDFCQYACSAHYCGADKEWFDLCRKTCPSQSIPHCTEAASQQLAPLAIQEFKKVICPGFPESNVPCAVNFCKTHCVSASCQKLKSDLNDKNLKTLIQCAQVCESGLKCE